MVLKPYFETDLGVLYNCDCLSIMPQLDPVDLVLTDPPYGLTQNKKDIAVDLSGLFKISKGVVMTTQQPYTTDVISRFRKSFRYEIIWDKVLTSGFLNANKMPLRSHENILIFGKVKYNPQMAIGNRNHSKGQEKINKNDNYGDYSFYDNKNLKNLKHPKSIVTFKKPHSAAAKHRTEKPISLMDYLIKTYSDEKNSIIDPFIGSGTTAIACEKLNRRWIGIEISEAYAEIAKQRIINETRQTRMPGF